MVDWIGDIRWKVWEPLPSWAKWSFAIWIILSLDAVRMAWGEHRFVGGYFEALVADFLFAGIPLFAFVAAIFAGSKAYDKSKSALVGWAAGIFVFLAIGYCRFLAEEIPGVGWRIEKMQEAHDLAEELE